MISDDRIARCGVSEWDNEYVNIEQEALGPTGVSTFFSARSQFLFPTGLMIFFWQKKMTNDRWQVLFELILAANYLDIKSLLDLTCAKVASMIKGKNTEDTKNGTLRKPMLA